ncbi:hypothetical protein [Mycoplasma zalophi]|uniref:Uncharacterized protein n=1 Tax=Mycoplasma zalophi TaxID=191287 RepID=A0ABS6DQB8_9MOLU|nr:hypothetical protein [Mycoplasma zalophi]MBU4690741.1 hypothetical protein [Mycoplasma zalophi]MBU4692443.1 hypothetical protein [Mycoplasma zalophi]
MISRKKYWQEYRDELSSTSSIQNAIKKENKNFNKKVQQIVNNIPDYEKMLEELNNELNLNFFPNNHSLNQEWNFSDDIKIASSIEKIKEIETQINKIVNDPLNKKELINRVKKLILDNEILVIQNDLKQELENIKRGMKNDE